MRAAQPGDDTVCALVQTPLRWCRKASRAAMIWLDPETLAIPAGIRLVTAQTAKIRQIQITR
jgi:hypothetical protein